MTVANYEEKAAIAFSKTSSFDLSALLSLNNLSNEKDGGKAINNPKIPLKYIREAGRLVYETDGTGKIKRINIADL